MLIANANRIGAWLGPVPQLISSTDTITHMCAYPFAHMHASFIDGKKKRGVEGKKCWVEGKIMLP